jgi:hypothetical protein
LAAGKNNIIKMKLAKAHTGKATFKITLRANGRPVTETRNVKVVVRP